MQIIVVIITILILIIFILNVTIITIIVLPNFSYSVDCFVSNGDETANVGIFSWEMSCLSTHSAPCNMENAIICVTVGDERWE